MEGKLVELALLDMSGLEEYGAMRATYYTQARIILLCFSIGSPESLERVLTVVCEMRFVRFKAHADNM